MAKFMGYYKSLSVQWKYPDWWLNDNIKNMKPCPKCGANNWKWNCMQGLITGYCQGCGEKTNTFKARKGRDKKKKTVNSYGLPT